MKKLVCALTVASLAAAPVSASVRDAAFASSADNHASRTSTFVGATYRVGLHPRDKARNGRLSLKLSGMTMTPGSGEIRLGQGLELTGGQSGKPAIHFAGQDIGQLERHSNLSTGATIAIGVGLVLVVGAVVLATTKPWECYDEDQHSRCD